MNHYPPNLVRDFLDKNPEGNYADFAIKTGSKMGSRNFSYIKIKYRKEKAGLIPAKKVDAKGVMKRPYIRRACPNNVYTDMFTVSVEKLLKEPMAVFTDFISMLNRTKRVNCQMIELKNPNNIEIREVTK